MTESVFTCVTKIVLLMLMCACACAQPQPNPTPVEKWYTQTFDHFNNADKRTFKQRYLVYDGYYSEGGPIFFTAGGESDVYGGYNHNGFQFELAKKLNAIIVYAEHRFYGNSLPFGPIDSYTKENIKGLKMEQVFEDNVNIINAVKAEWKINKTPLVAWGGSYAGELVAYFRVAHPEIIHASVAGSAPSRYHYLGDIPNGEYFKVTTEGFGATHSECPNLVRKAFTEILEKTKTTEGSAWVTKELALCESITKTGNRMIALWAENAYAQLAMLDYPWVNHGAKMPKWPLEESCKAMLDNSLSFTKRLGMSVGVLYNNTFDKKCFNVSEDYYPCADITGCGGGVGDPNAMSWDYQSCTELISNVDTNNVTDMFPPAKYDYNELTNYCQKTWGATPTPVYLQKKFDYSKTSRILWSNGLVDPWYPGGELKCNTAVDQYCILIPHAAHHLDFYGADPVNDPNEVVVARMQEEKVITRWVYEIRKELQA